uniref:zinc finger protein 850-like n=1 Tax=Semicossyphus pulcher TaxID=241346 RepID=UPI0037E9B96C
MSSVECLREFVSERLTAAAEEIFGVFKRTIVEYEEEIDRQRRLLGLVLNPEIKLKRIELPQQHVCREEEVLADQQLCTQTRNFSLDQDEPEPPEVKEEQEELCTSQEGEHLVLKQETDSFMLISSYEESDQSENQTLDFNHELSQNEAEMEHFFNISIKSSVVPKPNTEHQLFANKTKTQDHTGGVHGDFESVINAEFKPKTQDADSYVWTPAYEESAQCEPKPRRDKQLFSHSSLIAESQGQTVCRPENSGSTTNEGTEQKNQHHNIKNHHNNRFQSELQRLLSVQTGENTCLYKDFQCNAKLNAHVKSHTSEKPYLCKTCGKRFLDISGLNRHFKIHSDEKQNLCNTCGKRFSDISGLNRHIRIHTGEKQYICQPCGKVFRYSTNLKAHMRTHTGEKPFNCTTCGRAFRYMCDMKLHIRRVHTGETPYGCKTCGQRFFETKKLKRHMKIHMERDIVVLAQFIYDKTTMSSVEYLRQFVSERLTAAAEEIFGVFERIIIGYEGEIDRQRRLLDVVLNPEIKLNRIELPQQHVSTEEEEEEEVLPDQQLCNQERDSPEPPEIKEEHEEQEELGTSQEGEQLVLKEEIETFIFTPTYEESDHSEPELNVYQQLLSQSSHEAESQGQKDDRYEDLELTGNLEQKPETSISHSDNLYNPNLSDIYSITETGKKSFPCDICGKDFTCKSKLQRHLRTHTGEKPYLCNTCGKGFCDVSVLRRHMSVHTGEKPCFCPTCGKTFSDLSVLRRHMSIHTGEKPFTCKICGKDFRLSSVLKVHMRTHTGEKPHVCKTCGKRFCELSVLVKHMRVHTGEKPFTCKTCGKDFRQSSYLIVHMRTHTGERPYHCKTCNKRFSDISVLIRHMKTHTGEKPHLCKTCGKRFSDHSVLKTHMSIHTGEKPFTCRICGKDFRLRCVLKVHMRTHTGEKPHLCKTCGKSFSDLSVLRRHMSIHTGEKPFTCETCGRAFRHSSYLTVHMRTHTEERPFVCKTCGRDFRHMNSLVNHMKTHTNKLFFLLTAAEFLLFLFNLWRIWVLLVQIGGPLLVTELLVSENILLFTDMLLWELWSDIEQKSTMSSVESLREFVNERLTAAAEEIFGHFKRTIAEYEEEIDRQRRLLDVVWKPEIKLHRIDLQQQHVCKEEEVLTDQHLCIQERNYNLDQEDPDPPVFKEEQKELCSSQEGEQLILKRETDTFMLISPYEESDNSEHEPKSSHQLLSHNFHVAVNKEHNGGLHIDSGSTTDAEPEPKEILHKSRSHSDNRYNPTLSEMNCETHKDSVKFDTCGEAFKNKSRLETHQSVHIGKKTHICKTCGKLFSYMSTLKTHLRIHTGEKPYFCKTCGKDFRFGNSLKSHMRIHTGERPFLCKICGKRFTEKSKLKNHIRIHTGEKPYPCKTCGKYYNSSSDLRIHMRTHTGEKLFTCNFCEKKFCRKPDLNCHIRIHTGEKPFTCQTCGRCFRISGDLTSHIRRAHTGERPYLCKICGKTYFVACDLTRHMKSHAGK